MPALRSLAPTVLIVDDEAAVRRVMSRMLSDLGYAVRSVASTEDAVGLFDSGIRADLLIVDRHMDGISGDGLIDEVLARRPAQRVLRVSGDLPADDELRRIASLLKPFTRRELRDAVAAALVA